MVVTTRNAKRASSSHTFSKEDEKTNENNSISYRNPKRSVVKKKESLKEREARIPLRENVSIVERKDTVDTSRSTNKEEEVGNKTGESLEKPLVDVIPSLEPQSLPIWDPVDNWFDETKTCNVKRTFSRKHNLLR